ncbi:hypothetical protein GSF24_19140 [Microbispora triticiradicis]|nr:hypothetical protein [Microbispora triticiradicis]
MLWHAEHELVEHTIRLNGLFEADFIKEIADVVGLTLEECRELHEYSKNPREVQEVGQRIARGRGTSVDEVLIECWLSGTVLRGVYHDELAQGRRRQHFRHPLRSYSQTAHTNAKSVSCYEVNSAQYYFAGILLAASFAASRKPVERVKLYAENLYAARAARFSGKLLLGEPDTPMSHEVGLDRAVREAQQLIRDGVLDVSDRRVTAVAGILSSLPSQIIGFWLAPWAGALLGLGSAAVDNFYAPGPRMIRRGRSSRKRLEDLAQAGAGAVDVRALR